MNLYTQEQCKRLDHAFSFITVHVEDHVLSLTLDRADKKNALHPQMMNEIAYVLHHAHFQPQIWVVIIKAEGNVFCAGADLKAMAGIIEDHESSVPLPEGDVLLGDLFDRLHKPTIAQVEGDVYAGGFFFLAGCKIVVASDHVKFGLPEVKRGLFPFQVMAALMKVMPPRKVLDWCIRGYNLPVSTAVDYGLVTEVVKPVDVPGRVTSIASELKSNSPSAIKYGLEAYDRLFSKDSDHQYLFDMLQKTIGTKDGMEGLRAFREKRPPVWQGS